MDSDNKFLFLAQLNSKWHLKRAYSLITNQDEYFICGFHLANIKQIIFG
jgi:hypothetical protein